MKDYTKMSCCATASKSSSDLQINTNNINNLRSLLNVLGETPELPIVFRYSERTMASGYHVTEVMANQVSSLDCGSNPTSWTETVIQLLDVSEPLATHMQARKFIGILGQVANKLNLDKSATLKFEVGRPQEPKQIFKLASISLQDGFVDVGLGDDAASCKAAGNSAMESNQKTCCA